MVDGITPSERHDNLSGRISYLFGIWYGHACNRVEVSPRPLSMSRSKQFTFVSCLSALENLFHKNRNIMIIVLAIRRGSRRRRWPLLAFFLLTVAAAMTADVITDAPRVERAIALPHGS